RPEWFLLAGLGRFLVLGGFRHGRCRAFIDAAEDAPDFDFVAVICANMQNPCRRRRNPLGCLFRFDFAEDVVLLNEFAFLLEPLRDGAFCDRFTETGDDDVNRHDRLSVGTKIPSLSEGTNGASSFLSFLAAVLAGYVPLPVRAIHGLRLLLARL